MDINTNAINKVTMYERRLGRPNGDVIFNALILKSQPESEGKRPSAEEGARDLVIGLQ